MFVKVMNTNFQSVLDLPRCFGSGSIPAPKATVCDSNQSQVSTLSRCTGHLIRAKLSPDVCLLTDTGAKGHVRIEGGTLMQAWVAAHSQYLLGEKHRAWITSPASKEYSLLPSARSHSMATPSCTHHSNVCQQAL